MKFLTKLKRFDACPDAIEWAKDYKTFQEVWDNCERADWLLWIAGYMSDKGINTRQEIVLCACKCARRSLKYVEKGEKRPLKAIQVAEKWANGNATLDEVRDAYSAAYYSAYSAAYYSAYSAAYYSAASAAASYASSAASYASSAAASAYSAAAAYSAKTKEHKAMCKIIRKMLKCPL